MQHLTASKLVGLEAMTRALVASMITAGFEVVAIDGKAGTTVTPDAKSFYLRGAAAIDPAYAAQPWGVLISASNADKQLSMHVLPVNQIDAITFKPAMRDAANEVGRISKNGAASSFFIDMTTDWKINTEAQSSAYPLTYNLCVSDHGFAVHINAEGLDNTGTAFSWLVVQRPVQSGDVKPGENSPLFAVFSCGGGMAGDPDTLKPDAVQRFTVIEKDVFAATAPISAVIPSADATPIINPMQQVMIAPNNRAVVLFPQLINSHRYVYFAVMDMLGYTSADVLSAGTKVDLNPTSASNPTTYLGMNANGKDNRGMRVLFPISVA